MTHEEVEKLAGHQLAISDALTDAYVKKVDSLVSKASRRVAVTLASKLTLDANGRVAETAANRKLLASVDSRLIKEMNRGGFKAISGWFAGKFDDNLPLFEEVLQAVADSAGIKAPAVDISTRDEATLGAVKTAFVGDASTEIEQAAIRARRDALLRIGVTTPEELTDAIADRFHVSIVRAEVLAETAINYHYRTLSDRSFQKIEAKTRRVVLYDYYGPDDKLTRSFCKRLVAQSLQGKRWTRKEIDAMDNGSSLANVFRSCGGYRCRHRWLLVGFAPIGTRDPKDA